VPSYGRVRPISEGNGMRNRVLLGIAALGLLAMIGVSASSGGMGPMRARTHSPTRPARAILVFLPADVREGKIALRATRGNGSAAPARATTTDLVRTSLKMLFAYPSKPDERHSKRMPTAVPPGVRVLGVDVQEKAITVNLSSQVLKYRSVEKFLPFSTMRDHSAQVLLAQIVFTASEPSKDASVQVLVGGKKLRTHGKNSLDTSRPSGRQDFRAGFLAEDESGRPIQF